MKTLFGTVATVGLLIFAGPLSASTINYDVTTNANADTVTSNYDSMAGLSQHVGTCFTGPPTVTGPCGSVSASTAALGATSSNVSASRLAYDPQNGIYGSAQASAYANLATGSLGALGAGLPCVPATPLCADQGSALARFEDTVTFDNTTGSAVNLVVNWSFDGTIDSTADPVTLDRYTIQSLFCIASSNTCAFLFDNANEFVFQDASGTITNTMPTAGWLSTSLSFGANGDSENFQGVFSIPTGLSTDFLVGEISIFCQMAVCDFSHTGTLSFGGLPNGVTFTSASGVLLTQNADTPEPGSALLTMCGGALLALGTFRSKRRRD